MQVAPLGQGDHVLGGFPQSLGLGLGGRDLLVTEQFRRQAAEQGTPLIGRPAQQVDLLAMSHRANS